MKRLIPVLALAGALASAGTAEAKQPYVSVFHAKTKTSQSMRAFAAFRFDTEFAWNDHETTVSWDDYRLHGGKCTRRSRSVVDCKAHVNVYESDEEDDSLYTTGEDCRWMSRTRVWRSGGRVHEYTSAIGPLGEGEEGDWNPVECTDI